AHVVQPVRVATELVLALGHGPRQTLRSVGLAHEAQARRELLPGLVGDLASGELVERGAGVLPERLRIERVERGAHDSALREQAGAREVEKPGEQLAPGEVTRRPEEHDHVRLQWRDELGVDVGGIVLYHHAPFVRRRAGPRPRGHPWSRAYASGAQTDVRELGRLCAEFNDGA